MSSKLAEQLREELLDGTAMQEIRRNEGRFAPIDASTHDSKDPAVTPEPGMSVSAHAHPILAHEAQFSGVPPRVNPSVPENPKANDAAREELTNQNALKLGRAHKHTARATSTPRFTRSGS